MKSESKGLLYKGISKDPEKRLLEHNSGRTKSTKGHIPWKLIYTEKFKTRQEAREREKYFKSGSGREYLNKILDL